MNDASKRLGGYLGLAVAVTGLGLTFDCYSRNGDSCEERANLAEAFAAVVSSTASSTDAFSMIEFGQRST